MPRVDCRKPKPASPSGGPSGVCVSFSNQLPTSSFRLDAFYCFMFKKRLLFKLCRTCDCSFHCEAYCMIKQRCLEKNTVQKSIPYHSIPFNVKSIPYFLLCYYYYFVIQIVWFLALTLLLYEMSVESAFLYLHK